jgi:hypothetical protein
MDRTGRLIEKEVRFDGFALKPFLAYSVDAGHYRPVTLALYRIDKKFVRLSKSKT